MTNILELAAAHKALATALEKVHAAEQRLIKASAPATTEEPKPEPTPAALKYPVGTKVRILAPASAAYSHAHTDRCGTVAGPALPRGRYDILVNIPDAGDIAFHNAEVEAILEEPTLWGYKVGDRVRYTHPGDDALLGVRVVGAIEVDRLRLDVPGGRKGIGYANSADRIRLAV